MLLLGNPGAGKTTTLLYYAQNAALHRRDDPGAPLPILANIALWDSQKQTPLPEWLQASYGAPEDVAGLLARGEALLLLDGLDELGGERPVDPSKPDGEKYDPRLRFMQAVNTLVDSWQSTQPNRILITSRVADYKQIGQKIGLSNALQLQPLNDDQLATALTGHPELLAAIREDTDLADLFKTPLIMSLFAFAWDEIPVEKRSAMAGRVMAPSDVRDTLLEAFIRKRYAFETNREQLRGATLSFTYDEMMAVLGELAMWNAQNWRPGKSYRDDDNKPEENVLIPYDLEYIIKDDERAEQFKHMTTHLNILAPINEADYRFVHLLLRDFLAYTFALPRLRDQSDISINPISALGKIGDARAVDPLIACLGDEDTDVRRDAARALGKIGDVRAVEPLVTCLGDEVWQVRQDAAEALGNIGDVRAIEPLIACLGDDDVNVRILAEEMFRKFGESAIEPLIACLGDENERVRKHVWGALHRFGASAVYPLLNCLSDANPDNLVRGYAASFLGSMGRSRGHTGKSVMELLFIGLQDKDESDSMRMHMALALAIIGEPAVKPLIDCLRDEDWQVRGYAAGALGEIGEPAIEPLIACLRDQERRVRKGAAYALGKIGWQPQTEVQKILYLIASQNRDETVEKDGTAVEPLIAYLRDEDMRVRRDAAEALGDIGDARAVEPLLACLRDEDEDVRWAATKALGQIGDTRAVEPLIACLRDEDEDVRRAAAEALGDIGDGRAVEPLIACLTNEDSDLRQIAVEALEQIGWQPQTEDQEIQVLIASQDWSELVEKGGIAVVPLITCLRGEEWRRVRVSAARALGKIGDARAVAPLIACLTDKDSHVRRNAAGALGNIGWQPQTEDQEIQVLIASQDWNELVEKGGIAVAPLITCLTDEDSDVRMSAAEALGKIGDARAVEPLIVCLDDQSNYVRRSAAEALVQIGWQPQTEDQEIQFLIASQDWDRLVEKAAIEPLIACLRDNNAHAGRRVRRHAAKALVRIGEPAVEALISCLNDGDASLQKNAAEALGKIGDARAVEPLIQLLDDKEKILFGERVCDYAYDALQAIGTPKALQACADWISAGNEPRPVD